MFDDAAPEPWPTFRGNETRSGSTADKVPLATVKTWETVLGGRLSAPVIASGRLLVSAVDQGRVLQLNLKGL